MKKLPLGMGNVVGLALGPILLIIVLMLPLPLSGGQQRLLGLMLLTVAYWGTGALPIPITSILALALATLLGIAPANEIFRAFSSPIIFLLIGEFIITQSMIKYGLGRRMALHILDLPGVAKSTYRIIIVFGAVAVVLASVINSAAVAATMVPIAVGLVEALSPAIRSEIGAPNSKNPLRFSTALMLITAYGSVVGGLMTPFGDPSNLVGWFFMQKRFHISFPVGTWIIFAAPVVVAQLVIISIIVLVMNRPEIGLIPKAAAIIKQQKGGLGPMSNGEINTAIAFCLAIILWLLPSVVGFVMGYRAPEYALLRARLSPAVGAIFGATLLFILPVSLADGFTLQWRDTRKMDWGPVLLVGSSVALGKLMAMTGLAKVVGDGLAHNVSGVGALGVYLFAATIAILFSELTTNLASVSVLVPIVPALALAGGGNPLEATIMATFAGVYGFALPISTSANAIVYASGEIPFLSMVKTGILVDFSGIVVVVAGVRLVFYLLGAHIA